MNVPAFSFTTLGFAADATAPAAAKAWLIAVVSSPPLGDTVVWICQEALGTPPTELSPGSHLVARLRGRMSAAESPGTRT